MSNVVAFIVARLTSSRLPQKQLKRIGEKRLIDWVIEHTKESRLIDRIVIATTNNPEDGSLIDVAKEHGIDIFLYPGDENDVVGRLTAAAIEYRADIPVLISGDSPLIYAPSLDKLIGKIKSDDSLDCVVFCEKGGASAIHEGMMAFRLKGWILADRLSKEFHLREHQFPIIFQDKGNFKVGCVEDDELFYRVKHRVSVDTLADLRFMNVVYEKLKSSGKPFNMREVVGLLLREPEIMDINRDVHQMAVGEKQKRALFLVKDGSNLSLFFELAYELTKRGVGVRFFAREVSIRKSVLNEGFGVTDNLDGFDFVVEER